MKQRIVASVSAGLFGLALLVFTMVPVEASALCPGGYSPGACIDGCSEDKPIKQCGKDGAWSACLAECPNIET